MKCYMLFKLESPNWKLIIYRGKKNSKFTKASGKGLFFAWVIPHVDTENIEIRNDLVGITSLSADFFFQLCLQNFLSSWM